MTDHIYIIAEAGVNHNGDLSLAKKMVEQAKLFNCDAVKFQTFTASSLVTQSSKMAGYQIKNMNQEDSQFNMLKKLELNNNDFSELKKLCHSLSLDFLSSPFDEISLNFLIALGMKYLKIPSGEITNIPFLRKIGKSGLPVILSTGMATISEIDIACSTLVKAGTDEKRIILLQCNTEYPTPFEDVNLKAMITLKETFKVPVGFSDHTPGIHIPVAAAALGARVIEKHFTLDKNLPGPDHKASLEPGEFGRMVRYIRDVEKSLGKGIKAPSPSEMKNREIVRKKIIAKKAIKKGEIFSEDNLTTKRSSTGIGAEYWDLVIGKTAGANFEEEQGIQL